MEVQKNKIFIEAEDTAVLWIGSLLLISTLLLIFLSSSKTVSQKISTIKTQLSQEDKSIRSVAWHKAIDKLKSTHGSKEPLGKWLKKISDKPGSWKDNPSASFQLSARDAEKIREDNLQDLLILKEKTDSLAQIAERFWRSAEADQFSNADKNIHAKEAIDTWKHSSSELAAVQKKYESKSFSKWPYLILLFVFFCLIFGFAQYLRGYSFKKFTQGFVLVFILAVVSFFIAGQSSVKNLGIGYAAWSIIFGLIISNTIALPDWIKGALTTELYIKTGLVLLGAEILFGKILAIGLPGIFVAWIVTPIVLLSTYWFGQKVLKIGSKTLNITVSADMSVCGVSAAVATAAASKASKEELTLAIGLSMIFTSVMMIVLPIVINALGMPEILGGAWIGGTIDATGAVVAAGAFLGDDALNVAATIKMIQNILIGVIAFGVAIYFSRMEGAKQNIDIGWSEIWKRFPKFILGFIGASIIFSIVYAAMDSDLAYALIDQGVIGGFTKNIRGWLFCLAFVSIGLSTNFRELKSHFSGGKPLILYICGQTFNLALTLLMAYIMFYIVFPEITANI